MVDPHFGLQLDEGIFQHQCGQKEERTTQLEKIIILCTVKAGKIILQSLNILCTLVEKKQNKI